MKHFNFFTNRVVKSFRGLALAALVLLSIGNAWGTDYTAVIKSFTTSTPPTGWTTNGTFNSSYYKMTAGQYAQGTATSLFGSEVLSTNMTINIACGTFGTWSGAKTITFTAAFYNASNAVLTSQTFTTGALNSTQGTYRGDFVLTKPADPSQISYLKITSTTHTTGTESRFAAVKLTYSTAASCTAITPTLSYSASVNAGSTLNPTLSGNTGSGAVTYSSSNESVLTVNASGVVIGVASGTATVTASIAAASTYCAGSATSGTITVNCNSAGASFASSSVSKASTDANFTNTLTTSNTGAKTFASSNTAVATVNATTGEVDVLTAGTTTISVTQPETSGICAVNTSYSLTVSSSCSSAATVWDASTVNKTYGNAAFTNAFLSDNTGAETYASSNTGVATVNPTTGEVTIAGVGSTTISVTQPETGAYCAVSTSYTLNVTCATLAIPAAFTTGTVAATTIDFSWNAVANASSYTLTYTDGVTNWTKTAIAGTSSQLTGLTPSTQYLITVKAVGNGTTYCTSAESTMADVTTTALPTYTLTWNVNGSTSTTSVVQGNAIGTLPTNPTSAACDNVKVFVGWTTAPYTNASVAPTYISTATVPSASTTYYAVFAEGSAGVAVNTVLWAENFTHFNLNTPSAAGTGTGTTIYGGATITYNQSSTLTKAYNESTGGGTSPELLLTKTAPGTWTISGIKTGGATGMSLTFLSNKTAFSLTSPTSGISITGSAKSWTITATSSVTTFDLVLGNTDTGNNARVDNVELKVTESSSYVNFATSCVACDANTLALTSTTQTMNIGGGGTATYDVSTLITSKNGNGAVTYTVTPTTGTTSVNLTTGAFSTETAGTYYVSVIQELGSEGTPICAKTVKDTIVVLAQPVVTIVDVTPLTFTANCGEASVAQSVSVSGYNLTANMTATAPTNFLVSSNNSTYGTTASFTQASGSASGTLYIKANPPAGSANPISGNVTLASTDATTRTLAVSATVSCTPVHIYFNDKGNVVADSTEYVGGTVSFPANPSCTDANYSFDGWYTATLNDASSYTKVTAPYTVTGETTLYAVYKHSSGSGSSTSNLTSALVTGLEVMAYASTYTKDVDGKTWTFTGCYRASGADNLQMNSTSTRYIQTPDMGSEITSVTINVKRSAAANIGIYTTSGTLIKSIAVTTTAADYTETISGYNQVRIYNSTTGASNFYSVSVTAGPAATYTTNPLCCPNQLATPTNFAATAGDTQASLSWDAVANASSYNIECTTNPAKNVTGATGTSTTITGLTNCTTYSFKITAMGDNTTYCQSVASTAVTATPQAAVLTATFNAGTNGTCGTASLTNTCLSNDITLPSATPNVGFAFDGWQVGGAGTVYAGGSTFTLSANVTLVAKYRVLATYAISFMNEGVEVDSLVQIVTEGSAAAVESRTMLSSCSEYTFKGWSTTAITGHSATAPTYYNFATAVTGPVTLYAVYSFVDTSNGGSNEYTLVTNKADLTAGAKVVITYGSYVMGAQTSDYRTALASGATAWTKTGDVITLAAGSTAAVLTVGIDGTYYTFNDGAGYLYSASTSSTGLLRTQSALDAKSKWTLGTISGVDGKCSEVKSQTAETRSKMLFNTSSPRFSCYSSGTDYMIFYKNSAAAEYTTNPICSPMIVVDQTDVENSIDSTNFVIGLGGTATSTGHTVFSKNCTSASYVQPVIFGVDKAVFSVNWTRVYLDNGAMDTVYTVSYSPVIGDSHKAFLYFETDDHTVISDTIPLYGEVCTAVVFGSQSATENTITINWTAPSVGSSLRVWNTITVPNGCTSAPQPFDQTYVLGTEVTKTVTGLKASGTYYYQATSGTCVSEQRTIVTPAASGVPALTASSSTIEFVREIGKDTTQSVSLSGVYMNNASVSVAITGAGAAAFTTNASITLDATGKGTLSVTYHPTSSQTFVAVATITYTSGCETKTVVVNLIGNVPGIDMVEINGDATGFVIHTDFQGTPDIVLSQEVEHAGSGKVANDLFFSKYYEAYSQVKLMGIYNGTTDSIPLKDIRIVQKKAYKATDPKVVNGTYNRAWSSATAAEVVAFSNAFWTNYKIPPRTEMILFTSVNDATTMNCVRDGLGFNHDYWFPVGPNAATYSSTPNYFGTSTFSFGGDKSIALQRKRANGSWEFIDLVGAGDTIYAIGDSTKTITANGLNDDPGWYCPDGTNYKTKEVAPLSTNRHLLIRKNTVVDGLNAVSQNKVDMETLCAEWEGLNVPTKPDSLQALIACEHFSQVAEFNYDGYYSSFERVNEGLVTFTPVGATAPGDWVGTFDNPTTTFQDTLRCYNLQISILRYYNTLEVPPLELTKAQVQAYQADAGFGDVTAQAIIAALDTVEAASVQWRVPIVVKTSESIDTYHARFTDLSVDTCQTCDVVILNGGTLTKSANVDDRDSVRSVIVYNGGRLIVPDGRDYVVNDLQVRAKGDSVGAAFIEGNLMMKNPRVIHDKRVENDKPYFFTLPYDCPISKITQMNGKTMGPYGATWVIKYYDGAQRIQNRGLSSNWKPVDAGATLKAGVGYVLYISSDVYKYVRFPMVATATFTEKNTGKSMDVAQYGHAQAYGTNGTDGTLGWNNVGWNLVGNPFVSYFMAQGAGDSIMNGSTILKGRYLPNGGYNENTWKLDDTANIYITVPDAVADGGYLQKRVSLTQLDPFISFFVQADRTGSLNFETSSREAVSRVMRAPVVDYNEVVLNFDVAGKSDRTTIILDKARNTSYEIGQDLLKWKGKWGKTPYLYSFDSSNNPLVFNAMNYDEAKGSVPVAFYMPTSYARYTFSIDRNASNLQGIEHVYLLRNGSNIADLLTTNYTATDLKIKQENKEFAISIQRAAEVVTPVNPTDDDLLMPRAITERHEVRVEQLPAEGTVFVMDAIGRTVANRTLSGADNMTFELPVDGVYTITVMTPARNYTLKTVIR